MIECLGFNYKSFNFPCGEKHVIIKDLEELPSILNINFIFEKNEDIIELLLLANAIKEIGGHVDTLYVPYVPYSRQDRINLQGECFSLKVFCSLINSIGAKKVIVEDPHSDVTPALLDNCVVIHQHEIFYDNLAGKDNFYLVSPDGGSLKKIYKLAAITNPLGVIEFTKKRNISTGEITGVHAYYENIMWDKEFYIVDDICDGGRTFIEIAKELKEYNCKKIILMVTHGFFTKGLGVFDGLIDEIYTLKGRVK